MITLIATFVAIVGVAALLGAFRSSGQPVRGSCGGLGCTCTNGASASGQSARAEILASGPTGAEAASKVEVP